MVGLILVTVVLVAFLWGSIWVLCRLFFEKNKIKLMSYKCTNIVDGECMPISGYDSRFIEEFEKKYPIYSEGYGYEYYFLFERKGEGRLVEINIMVYIVEKKSLFINRKRRNLL